uniref:Uncharacterized protein n=1 Tax=Arundo donax TaxID=35708 RepID=A0A0A9HUX6_ARUDO
MSRSLRSYRSGAVPDSSTPSMARSRALELHQPGRSPPCTALPGSGAGRDGPRRGATARTTVAPARNSPECRGIMSPPGCPNTSLVLPSPEWMLARRIRPSLLWRWRGGAVIGRVGGLGGLPHIADLRWQRDGNPKSSSSARTHRIFLPNALLLPGQMPRR